MTPSKANDKVGFEKIAFFYIQYVISFFLYSNLKDQELHWPVLVLRYYLVQAK